MSQAKRQNALFHFDVTHDTEANVWVGVCDALPVATEAETYEALVQRVWSIAPEIAEANHPDVDVRTMRLRFEYEDCAQAHDALTA
jgi:hypothetical protein